MPIRRCRKERMTFMNIFKRIWQALEKEEEIDRQRQKRLIEVSKVLDAYYSSEEIYDDNLSFKDDKPKR